VIGSGFTFSFKAGKTFSTLSLLRLTSLPAGSRLETTCTASKSKVKKLPGKASTKGCPFAKRSKTFAKVTSREDLSKLFKSRKLPVGTVIKLKVSSPGLTGKVFQLTVRKSAAPAKKTTCFLPTGPTVTCP